MCVVWSSGLQEQQFHPFDALQPCRDSQLWSLIVSGTKKADQQSANLFRCHAPWVGLIHAASLSSCATWVVQASQMKTAKISEKRIQSSEMTNTLDVQMGVIS